MRDFQEPNHGDMNSNFPAPEFEQDDDFLSEIDVAKLLVIAQKSLIWIGLLFMVCITGAFLYFRYTKPVYESSSVLKLDVKKEAGVLGFSNTSPEDMPNSKLSNL